MKYRITQLEPNGCYYIEAYHISEWVFLNIENKEWTPEPPPPPEPKVNKKWWEPALGMHTVHLYPIAYTPRLKPARHWKLSFDTVDLARKYVEELKKDFPNYEYID